MKKLIVVSIISLLLVQFGVAQKNDLFLTGDTLKLEEVSVKSLRYNKQALDAAIPVVVLTEKQLETKSGISVPEVLANTAGIALYRDGVWGTSLTVRGLPENRLVSMINGNRIETATDLAGGLSMLDANELERVEIIKGAASSIHGTGAMGGVINFVTKTGSYRDQPGFSGTATGSYHTANKMPGTHLGLETGAKKWKLRFSGGYRNAQNMLTPEGELQNSQFTDYNYSVSAGIKPLENHELLINFQDYVASDVGVPGGAPLAPTATATFLEAKRRLADLNYTIRRPGEKLSEIKLKYFNQFINRDVEMIPNTGSKVVGNKRITANKVLPSGAHTTNGMTVETHWNFSEDHALLAGIDVWGRQVSTSREKHITQEILDDFQMVIKTLELVRGEKPIPDASHQNAGLFVQDQISLFNNIIELQNGFRIDGIRVSNEEARDPLYLIINEVEQSPVPGQELVFAEQVRNEISWSLNTGAVIHFSKQFDLKFNLGRSYRTASLEERFKYIDLGSKVRLGDPELKPERGWFTDLGADYVNEKLLIRANVYANVLSDMIVEMPGSFVDHNTDTLPALINANVDQALLLGYELAFQYALTSQLRLFGSSSFTRGLNRTNETDLPLIAPMKNSLGFQYKIPSIFTVQWSTAAVSAQNRIAAGETATKAYWKSDFSLASDEKNIGSTGFVLILGVDNVFNANYVNHLATNRGLILVEPGRNVFLKLKMNF